MLFARDRLTGFFPDIRFGKEMETQPLSLQNPSLFLNQLAAFETGLDQESVIACLKEIEAQAGRLPGDKGKEKIVLDIDLLKYDDVVLKPEELKRDYIILGINTINQ